ncbi:hypothetical protein O6H91_07G057600 [Diphasiastrum complanatum]|uniref:Uncharacterized protein n=1 Tax=Diphasiastrum complanatum TaxID=34168 RepID=A0ACC2D5L8_DIPCM|nr:hypothetical protein O6H91_07G057600 [Diphasiastrum complanatum]
MLRKGSVSRGEMLADLIGGNFQRKHSLIYPSSEASEETCEDDIADDCIGLRVGKKRRLTIEQVRSLELSFETDNRLEPERKVLLATELGLQPRQVAVWFQNRRARWKTKQLEKDYNALKYSFDSLKTNYNALVLEKERLQAECRNRFSSVLRNYNVTTNKAEMPIGRTILELQMKRYDLLETEEISRL